MNLIASKYVDGVQELQFKQVSTTQWKVCLINLQHGKELNIKLYTDYKKACRNYELRCIGL